MTARVRCLENRVDGNEQSGLKRQKKNEDNLEYLKTTEENILRRRV